MSIIKYLIRLQKKPIVVNNFLLNYYVRSVRRKVEQNHKNSVFDYIVFLGFYLTISVFVICLMIDSNNMKARLYLFDLTIIVEGLRHYTHYFLILTWTGASLMYKYFHLTRDNKLMKWVEIFEYMIGQKSLADFTKHLILTSKQENLLKIFAKIMVNSIIQFLFLTCKY